MKERKLILAAAAVALMTALAGCGGGSNADDPVKPDVTNPDNPDSGNPSSKTFIVTFVSNGGSDVASQTVAEGNKATEPAAPTQTDYTFVGWFTDNTTFADRWDFASRTVTADITLYAQWFDGIAIYNADDLNNVRNNLSGNYILMNDISLADAKYSAGEGWAPIGGDNYGPPFTGRLKGNGHKITGLTINLSAGRYGAVGLFGSISGGSVSDLGVEIGINVRGYVSIGGIAGRVDNSTITNCYSTGNISSSEAGDSSFGGIAGLVDGSTIINCYSTVNITATASSSSPVWSGGIAGSVNNSGTITNCYSTGDITFFGGTSSYWSGGIAGMVDGSTIINCYSTGNISISGGSSCWSGGITGGGDGAITNCYSTGNISAVTAATGNYVSCYSGGITGNGGTITNCAAINLTIDATCPIANNAKAGRTTAYIYSGTPTISNNFALDAMSDPGTGKFNTTDPRYYGISKSQMQLQTKETYSNAPADGGLGWKFDGNNDDAPWEMPTGSGYPILYWQK